MDISNLNGGYRVPYDARPALDRLSTQRDEAIEELWENLYHQGDVDLASYAAVPALVDAGELSLVGAIEVARHEAKNPDLPEAMKEDYELALRRAMETSPKSEEHCIGYYIVHAATHGQSDLAKAIHLLDVSEILETYG